MIEIFIEDNRVDASSGISGLLTFAIDDVSDFGSRDTTFSKTIVLQGTHRNNIIFGNIFSSENQYNPALPNVDYNFNASKSARCVMFSNYIQVFKGVIRLLEVIVTDGNIEYECAVFGELTGFSTSLANKKLEDLDFSSYDHSLTVANISGSWNTINGSGYYYPLIDYGEVSTNKKDYQFKAFRPALYAKEYIDKIFSGIGWTYESNLFSSARFKSIIIPNNAKGLVNVDNELIRASRTTNYTFVPTFDFIPLPIQTLAGSVSVNGANTIFTYNSATTVGVRVRGNIRGDYDMTDMSDTLEVSASTTGTIGSGVYNTVLQHPGFGTSPFEFNFDFDFTATWITGTTIDLRLNASSGGVSATITSAELYVDIAISTPTEITYGAAFKINETIPKGVLQKDFIVGFLKLFNLYVFEDKFKTNHLKIEPYVDYYDTDSSNAVDWSLKIDRSKPIRHKPMSELNSRFYEFKFKQDSDYYNELYRKLYGEGYGDRIYDSEFEFSKDKTTVEILFSATPLVGYSGEDKVAGTIFKKNNANEEKIESNIRIMLAKKITGVASWDILDGVTVLGSLTDYGYAGHFDDPDAPTNDLNLGATRELYFTLVSGNISANQFNLYWSSYMAEISDKDSKLMICDVWLTSQDIFDLDFSKYVNIDGRLWRLNKIEDYNVDERDRAKLTLLKVINTEY
jgi:hypothetical protein